jgi:hypothetical protein
MTVSIDRSRAEALPKGRVPDFFIVGQFKSGTTALYEMLKRHPQIFMPELKELWFHSPELRERALARGSTTRPTTLEGYLSLFEPASPEQRAGEATPSYLISHEAAGRIAALQPAARIIAILREPASFLRSFHLQNLQNHSETEKDLRRAIELVEERREGRSLPPHAGRPQELLYTDHVHYVEQLQRYHAVFAPEQILVLIYDDFRDDNEATVRRVLRFLGVDDTQPVAVTEANPTVRVRSPRTSDFVRSLYMGSGPATRTLKRAIKALTPRALRREALAVERRLQWGAPRPPDEQLMLELRRRFKGEVVALGEYLDRDLVGLWGYDRLD